MTTSDLILTYLARTYLCGDDHTLGACPACESFSDLSKETHSDVRHPASDRLEPAPKRLTKSQARRRRRVLGLTLLLVTVVCFLVAADHRWTESDKVQGQYMQCGAEDMYTRFDGVCVHVDEITGRK